MDRRFFLLQLCFLLSGFSALLYQTAWTREFAFVFGTSEIAIAAVLAGYMGGLALGSAAAARLAPRIRRPVLAYGLLELGIAASALAIPLGMRGLTAAYVGLFAHDLPTEPGTIATVFRLGGAFLLMLVPTGLMGATLPLLARHAVRSDEEVGPRIGALYAVNTAGAIGGTLCAAFWLLPTVGLRSTVVVGAALNGAVFLAAAALSRGAAPPAGLPGHGSAVVNRWVLPLMMLSGAVSFSYEVLWTRLLSQLLGGSLYAFATMLSSFLLGIAAGSAVGGACARNARAAALGLALAELGVAFFAAAAFLVADQLPGLSALFGAGGRASPAANAPLAAVALLPAACCLGATFPFAVRLLTPDPQDTAVATARVYAWNTAGAIVGAIATGFVLLPALHFDGTAVLGAAASLSIAAAVCLLARPRPVAVLALTVAGALALVVVPLENPWRLLLATPLGGRTAHGEIRFEAAGRSSTVLLLDAPAGLHLRTNGLPEATIVKYSSTPQVGIAARSLALLPVLLRPETRRALVIGLGGGVALEGMAASVRQIDVVELEEGVVAANRVAGAERAIDPLAETRTRVVLNDARGALMLARRRYDAIVSQPSHPWTAGASHLYTREFFELVRDRLEPDGVMVQWIGLNFVDEPLLRTLLATLTAVFPEVHVYQPTGPALLFVGSRAPLDTLRGAAALAEHPEHFARNGMHNVEDVAAMLVLDSMGARAIASGSPPNTDDHNLLATRSARLGERFLTRKAFRDLVTEHDPLPTLLGRLDAAALVRSLARRGELGRVEAVVASLLGSERERARGWAEGYRGERRAAASHFRRALELDADALDAHAGLVVFDLPAPDSERTPPESALVRRALSLEREGDWPALAAIDEELAGIERGDPLRDTATRLRGQWRLATREALRAEEAIPFLDERLALQYRPGVQIERARAAHLAGRTTEAWATLYAVLDRLRPTPVHAPLLQRIAALARAVPDDALREVVLARVAAMSRRARTPGS